MTDKHCLTMPHVTCCPTLTAALHWCVAQVGVLCWIHPRTDKLLCSHCITSTAAKAHAEARALDRHAAPSAGPVSVLDGEEAAAAAAAAGTAVARAWRELGQLAGGGQLQAPLLQPDEWVGVLLAGPGGTLVVDLLAGMQLGHAFSEVYDMQQVVAAAPDGDDVLAKLLAVADYMTTTTSGPYAGGLTSATNAGSCALVEV